MGAGCEVKSITNRTDGALHLAGLSQSVNEGFLMKIFKSRDTWSTIVILLTVGLFCASLAVKGFTHELFLEAGVFLVSVKLILFAGKSATSGQRLEKRLDEIHRLLEANRTPLIVEEEKSTTLMSIRN